MLEQTFADGAEHGGSASGVVYEALRKKILSLDYPPGTALARGALSQEYGVSLTPVREAMQKLEEDGLLRIVPQSGTVVKRIDVAQLRETHFLRTATEAEVVRRLALDGDIETLARARALLTMQEALAGNVAQMVLFNEIDRAFHRTLFAGVGMTNLQTILNRRMGHLSRCQLLDLPSEGKMANIVMKHGRILDAIERRDPEGAMFAMRDHLSGTISRLEMLRGQFPEYFSEG